MLIFSCFLFLLHIIRIQAAQKLQNHFAWKILDFVFPTPQDRYNALATGRFIPENGLPVGIEVWENKMFISVPRWKEGIPATLTYVDVNSPVKNPPLIPYPDLESNELGNCHSGLSTVYRIHADACDRLWVLDTGTFGIDKTTQNPCPYALNIFDLRTDRRIRRYEFKKEDTNDRTFIANTLVDMGDTCDDAHAYFSDELGRIVDKVLLNLEIVYYTTREESDKFHTSVNVVNEALAEWNNTRVYLTFSFDPTGYGLIVYSYKENKSWRFEHSFFMPDPLKGDFNINGLNFQWGEEGIFGMSLSPLRKNGFRTLYFSPLASNREFAVSTQVLKNESKVEDAYHDFYYLDESGPNTHTTARVMNKDGVQFFNLIDQNAVGCWNYKTTYGPQNVAIVDKDDKGLIFACDVKVDKNNYLWVISDRMSDFLIAQLDYNDINFNVFFAPVDALIKNTVCEVRPSFEERYVPVHPQQLGYEKYPQQPLIDLGYQQINSFPQITYEPIRSSHGGDSDILKTPPNFRKFPNYHSYQNFKYY